MGDTSLLFAFGGGGGSLAGHTPRPTRQEPFPIFRFVLTFLLSGVQFASVADLHAHWDAEAAAYNAARRIEIVEVTRA